MQPNRSSQNTSMAKDQHVSGRRAVQGSHDTSDLNLAQRRAAMADDGHALVLAGAGCGKTKTIDARCNHLISEGVPAHQIYVLAFTRRSAEEIVARVEASLGSRGKGLQASTFHAFCMKMIRHHPSAFGCYRFSVIDREDQVDIFKALLGRTSKTTTVIMPTAAQLVDIYSFGRNTRCTPTTAIENEDAALLPAKKHIIAICRQYRDRKQQRKYLDYDDILEVVGTRLHEDAGVRKSVCSQFKHILVDEFQDTNPLQWHLLTPFLEFANLFCVGDDAQSIYGFRGADFNNVHRFKERVPDSTTLKLNKNYRSTQEILDVSNWLLAQSSIDYDKRLVAARGSGHKPRLLNFAGDWQEANWIAADIAARHRKGRTWSDHMILVRTAYTARAVEACLIERNIPYIFIGGTKLLETAHVKDLLSPLRIIANPADEIAWTRYLRLWPGIGRVKAAAIVERVLGKTTIEDAMEAIGASSPNARATLQQILAADEPPARAVRVAVELLSKTLEAQYKKDWDQRRLDFPLVEKLAQKHTSIMAFIEHYLLDPMNASETRQSSNGDVVFLITVHSAKGAERKVCYVMNVSPGAYPSSRAMGSGDQIEEERRVLYVALTRPQDELIITRKLLPSFGIVNAASEGDQVAVADAYFLKNFPDDLADEEFL